MARLTPNQANEVISRFKKTLSGAGQATDLFGKVRDDGVTGILRNLEQTWGGAPLYPNDFHWQRLPPPRLRLQ
jgi:DNA ligase (NAD+)